MSEYAEANLGSSRVSATRSAGEWHFTVWTLAQAGSVAYGYGFDSAEAAIRAGIDVLRLALEEERRRSQEWNEARRTAQ